MTHACLASLLFVHYYQLCLDGELKEVKNGPRVGRGMLLTIAARADPSSRFELCTVVTIRKYIDTIYMDLPNSLNRSRSSPGFCASSGKMYRS